MYPKNKRDALLSQLRYERAVRELTERAYALWLPHVRGKVFDDLAATPPDASGVSATQELWEYLIGNTVLYGLGLIYGREYIQTWRTLPSAVPGVDEPETVDAPETDGGAQPVPESDLAVNPAVEPLVQSGAVDGPEELRDSARRIVASHTRIEPDTVASLAVELGAAPTARERQSDYLSGVRNRMVNTPESTFRAIAEDVDAGLALGQSPHEIKEQVQKHLDAETGDWPGRAEAVARTETVGAQSAASLDAAKAQADILGEDDLQKVWICTIDSRTRPSHFAADGQRVALSTPFRVGTAELEHPGDPAGPPGEVINCRCRLGVLAADEPLPDEDDRHTERGPGDSTVKNRDGSQAGEIARRAEKGTVRARDTDDGLGSVAASAGTARGGATMSATPNEEINVAKYRNFEAVLAVIGEKTDDGRMFDNDIDLAFRDFPLPLLWQKQSNEGHFNSFTVGVIESASIQGTNVVGSGYMLDSPEALEAIEQAEHGITGPSVDVGDVTWELRDEDGNEIDWDNIGIDDAIVQTITAGKILGATLVSIPAFGQTSITIGEEREETDEEKDEREEVVASLVASVARSFEPESYAAEFFTDPQFSGPTLPHVTSDGRVQGHLATFNTCHVGISDQCVMAPRSKTDYAWFHTSPPVLTDDGTRVPVGRLTVGGGHAGDRLGVGPAVAHYDDTGTCFALVHVGEDAHGIWFSGIAAPGVSEDTLVAGLSAPLSGDWRTVGGNLELVAALAVNTPGFPIVASGATDARDEPLSLVASLGPCKDTASAPQLSKSQLRVFARELMSEMRATERRTAAAHSIIEKAEQPSRERRASAAQALISRMEG